MLCLSSTLTIDGRGEGVCVNMLLPLCPLADTWLVASPVVGGVSIMLLPRFEVPGESVESDMKALNGSGVLLDKLGVGFEVDEFAAVGWN